jgi:Tol biopolymer transport system component
MSDSLRTFQDRTFAREFLLAAVDEGTLVEGSTHYNFTAWSPIAHLIAFTADVVGDGEIYTVRADGSDQKRLTRSPGPDSHEA